MNNAGIGSPYWYEWQIGIIECLKMLTSQNIESVVLQSSEFEALDDVVINYKDGSITNIQVKHTDVDSNLTYSFLDSDDGKLISKLAKEWQTNKEKYNIKGLQLVTNKKWGTNKSKGRCSVSDFINLVYPKIKEDIGYLGSNDFEKNAILWFKEQIAFLGEDAKGFINVFSFRPEHGLEQTEEEITEEIRKIIGIDNEDAITDCKNSLFSNLRIWATSRRKNSQKVFKKDIYNALCRGGETLPRYEVIPQKPIFPSRKRFMEHFKSCVVNTQKKIIFLQGLPGAGKTNFVSYLAQLENSIVDFRFYTYLPVNQENGSYSDDEGNYLGRILWLSILTQLRKKFEEFDILAEIEFPFVYQYLSTTDMRSYVLKYLPLLARRMGKEYYLFIDGIDHAARSRNARDSFLWQLPRPSEMEDGYKFVLVGQPVNDKYPSWFSDNSAIDYIKMPSLEVDDIMEMLMDNDITMKGIDISTLANTIISVIGSNALNVFFAVMELKKMNKRLTFEEIERYLNERRLNNQIDKYYEWILNSIEKNMLFYKILSIFAFSSCKIPLNDIVQICNDKDDDIVMVLSKLYPLVMDDDKGYYVFHNDVRLHFQNEIVSLSNFEYIVNKLDNEIVSNKNLEKYKYDTLFNLLYARGIPGDILQMVNATYIMNGVLYEIPIDTLSRQYFRILWLIKEKHDYENMDKAITIAVCLAQLANCIRYYEKEDVYADNIISAKKTRAEKYQLDTVKDHVQIIEDLYLLVKNQCLDRGRELYREYFADQSLMEMIKVFGDNKELCKKMGYVCRYMSLDIKECDPNGFENYVEFIDGWLMAGASFAKEVEIRNTLSVKQYYVTSFQDYVKNILNCDGFDQNSFNAIKAFLTGMGGNISSAINLCVYGIYRKYSVEELTKYIDDHLCDLPTDDSFDYDRYRMVYLFRAWFCVYNITDKGHIKDLYDELLEKSHIGKGDRGYKTAMAQWLMSKKVFELFYDDIEDKEIDMDLIGDFFCFEIKYGPGPCFDSNSYEIVGFLREVFLDYARKNPDSKYIEKVCDFMKSYISFQKDARYIGIFNEMFFIGKREDQYLEWVNYWCGEHGAIWNQDYSSVEGCCIGIIHVLELFGKKELAQLVLERQKLKLFGYIDHKDYSLYWVLDYYHYLAENEEKLEKAGLKLLEISDAASKIGDNRTGAHIDEELCDVAVALGNKYLNALFEIKNNPADFVEWRMNVLAALYRTIDKNCMDDTELVALYCLTNAWIDARYESDRTYGRIDTLKEYNSKVIRKIKNPEIRERLQRLGNYEYNEPKTEVPTLTYNFEWVYRLLDEGGYTSHFERAINELISQKSGGTLGLLIELKDVIPLGYIERFTNNCVKSMIVKESEYGFAYTALRELFKVYYNYITTETWEIIFESILKRYAENTADTISSICEDIEIYTLYYILSKCPGKLEDTYYELCNAHISLITANGRLKHETYRLQVDDDIKCLSDLVKFQVGKTTVM